MKNIFKNLIIQKNSIQKDLFIGTLTALLFSSFIYLEHFGFTIKIINTLTALSALTLLLYISKRAILVSGFFIGLLWFYWIGYSFEYQGVGYMTPIITFAFAIIYMLFFGITALTSKVYIRAILLFTLSFFEPFDFNWLQIELLFVDSYIGVQKYQLIFVLTALTLPAYIKNSFKYISILFLVAALNYTHVEHEEMPLKIKLVSTDIKQEDKWLRKNRPATIKMIFKEIDSAIKEKYELIVLPESVFPMFLNKNPNLIESLLIKSKEISIVVGSLLIENSKHYNVTYIFSDGKYEIAKKMVLVPFGEYIPLPKFMQDFINENFFAGASDFIQAKEPTDFTIKGVKFRNAICYEATCQEIYDGDVKFVIAISNNAWFAPSIEPTLQNLLIKYYARKNGVKVYHSTNSKGTGIIY